MNFNNNIYCNNCGNYGHSFKKCLEPISSNGIIAFKIDFEGLNSKYNSNLSEEIFTNLKNININKYNSYSYNNINFYKDIKQYVKFLIISRKSSLGFIELMRGHYDTNDINSIINLYHQMYSEEINKLKKYNFNELWRYVWNITNIDKDNEYILCHKKFKTITNKKFIDYCNLNIKSKYEYHEWGFPKGRRSGNENNIECAIREFNEETNLSIKNYKILNIEPLIENLIGTNNIKYQHIYYFCICNNNLKVQIDKTNKLQYKEVGNIEWYKYNDVNKLLRQYHLDKKIILNNLMIFISNLITNIILNG